MALYVHEYALPTFDTLGTGLTEIRYIAIMLISLGTGFQQKIVEIYLYGHGRTLTEDDALNINFICDMALTLTLYCSYLPPHSATEICNPIKFLRTAV